MSRDAIDVCYLIAAIGFIVALKMMNSPLTARKGNYVAMVGMAAAIVATLFSSEVKPANFIWIGIAVGIGTLIGFVSGRKVQMTAMPQMVALLNGLGGGAVALVALFEYLGGPAKGAETSMLSLTTMVLSAIIGSISFSGSLIAFGKLQDLLPSRAITFKGLQLINLVLLLAIAGSSVMVLGSFMTGALPFILVLAGALLLGIFGVIGIGGADMPVVISLLNSFTGCAAGLAGFVLMNTALLIGGGLVGASGLILTLLMCTAMNRSLGNVLFGAVGAVVAGGGVSAFAGRTAKSYGVEDAAIVLSNASTVVVVPGYGLAVAQAQHQVKELADKLAQMGIDVKYAVHPVAGRMPGHMNVLLAEADVPYEQLYDLEDINPLFAETDVVLVIGANDVVNPAARSDKSSPIYGMPILDVDKARTVFVMKRSMNPGFAGIENELFLLDNTYMVFGNAKTTIAKLSSAMDPYL